MVKKKIVSAVGVAAKSSTPGLAAKIEAAMMTAIVKAKSEGITDQDEIRSRMLAARDAVKNGG